MPDLTQIRKWIEERPATIGLALLLTAWFGMQQIVFHHYGQETARWWFYFEQPPKHISPGMLFSVISHELQNLTHIGSNIVLLLFVGLLAEPKIGSKKVAMLVVLVGFVGNYIANLTAPIHQVWTVVGASGGILALVAYTGLVNRNKALEVVNRGLNYSLNGLYEFLYLCILLSIPIIPLYESLILGQFNSGHTVGILLGVIIYFYEYHNSGNT